MYRLDDPPAGAWDKQVSDAGRESPQRAGRRPPWTRLRCGPATLLPDETGVSTDVHASTNRQIDHPPALCGPTLSGSGRDRRIVALAGGGDGLSGVCGCAGVCPRGRAGHEPAGARRDPTTGRGPRHAAGVGTPRSGSDRRVSRGEGWCVTARSAGLRGGHGSAAQRSAHEPAAAGGVRVGWLRSASVSRLRAVGAEPFAIVTSLEHPPRSFGGEGVFAAGQRPAAPGLDLENTAAGQRPAPRKTEGRIPWASKAFRSSGRC